MELICCQYVFSCTNCHSSISNSRVSHIAGPHTLPAVDVRVVYCCRPINAVYLVGQRLPFHEGLFFLAMSADIQEAAQNTALFIVARLLIIFGTGCLIETCPILVSELSYTTQSAL